MSDWYLPRPEYVPAGEPWLVTKPRTQEWAFVQDSKVTLVSRLVPEVKP